MDLFSNMRLFVCNMRLFVCLLEKNIMGFSFLWQLKVIGPVPNLMHACTILFTV